MMYDKDKDETPVKMKPSLHLCEEELKEVAEWEVGEKYTVLVELKMTSKSEYEDVISGSFEIEKIKELPKPKGSFSKGDVTVAMDMKKLDYLR